MTTLARTGSAPGADPALADPAARAAAAASRRWRAIWRTHFYAGVISAPFLVMFALTGLVILYTEPIRLAVDGDLRRVEVGAPAIGLQAQADAVNVAFPDAVITSVVTPRNAGASTEFGLDDGTNVFVNPSTGEVLGSRHGDVGVIGLANRLHGSLNNDSWQISLPSVPVLLGLEDGPVWQSYAVGDVVLEIAGGWALVLMVSGLYLWWPRRSRRRDARSARALVVPRLGKAGRARWRDLHAIPGMLVSVVLLLTLVSGLPWASHWGSTFQAVANRISPNAWVDAPNSEVVTKGDLDRLGNRINWNTGDQVVPASTTPADDVAAPVSLDVVVAAAADEGLLPGYSISFPVDGVDDVGNPTYGSFTLDNSWPRRTNEARTLYLDQFSGRTLGGMDVYGYGTVSRGMDTLVSTHMGTQLGVVSRIAMTILCLTVLWSVVSAMVMTTKRQRRGATGLPRRPADVRMARRLAAITVVMAVLYPLWGLSALLLLSLDRFVVRRVAVLRRTFGQPDRPTPAPV